MLNVTLSFPTGSAMAHFIIDCGLTSFTPNWINSSLSGYINDEHVDLAFADYNAFVQENQLSEQLSNNDSKTII